MQSESEVLELKVLYVPYGQGVGNIVLAKQ